MIPNYLFVNLNRLESLYLQGNLLTALSGNVFAGLHNLTVLDLGGLQLNQIHISVFANLHDLEYLNLCNNHLSQLYPDTFSSLTKLKYIDISGNMLMQVDANTFTMTTLLYLKGDSSYLCCYAQQVRYCVPPSSDSLSSCTDLLASPAMRYIVWLTGSLVIGTNLLSLIFKPGKHFPIFKI